MTDKGCLVCACCGPILASKSRAGCRRTPSRPHLLTPPLPPPPPAPPQCTRSLRRGCVLPVRDAPPRTPTPTHSRTDPPPALPHHPAPAHPPTPQRPPRPAHAPTIATYRPAHQPPARASPPARPAATTRPPRTTPDGRPTAVLQCVADHGERTQCHGGACNQSGLSNGCRTRGRAPRSAPGRQ